MKKWEYKIVQLSSPDHVGRVQRELNIIGDEGWELIIYCPNIGVCNPIDQVLIFKREKI